MKKSEFGLIGLGVMGSNLALNTLNHGISLSVYNRSVGEEANVVSDFLAENTKYESLKGFTDLRNFLESLERPRKVLIMIKAGPAIDSVISQLRPFLNEGDTLIDGGNSLYLDTEKRIADLEKDKIYFIGCGISGGAEGARFGPSMMPGGPVEGYNTVAKILEQISAKDKNGKPCCTYIGQGGAGHYVKMIHNGIEYAEMQLLAEIYSVLNKSLSNDKIEIIFKEWNESELKSFLLEISGNILGTKDKKGYVLDTILDRSGNKGTGFWSVRSGLELGLPTTMMSSALYARFISAFKSERKKFSKMVKEPIEKFKNFNQEKLKSSYSFARIVNHHQGFEILKEASSVYNWNLNLSEIARIWTNGCIIRSSLMEDLSNTLKKHPEILQNKSYSDFLVAHETDLREFIMQGMEDRISLDCFWSAYNYWIALTTDRLPANLIQAQRDFFGGHTFQLLDDPEGEFIHYNWN